MRITRKPDGQLRYKYKAGEIRFCFSLLCEVGYPYQFDARLKLQELQDKGFVIAYGQELPSGKKPYYSDMAVRLNK